MRAVIQRVSKASVKVNQKTIADIQNGLLILIGIKQTDTGQEIEPLAEKITNLRIFAKDEKEFELSVKDVNSELLIVSQFTLFANTKKGNRPSFDEAAAFDRAKTLYEKFIQSLKAKGIKVVNGQFGATMQIDLVNDGPVTIIIDQ